MPDYSMFTWFVSFTYFVKCFRVLDYFSPTSIPGTLWIMQQWCISVAGMVSACAGCEKKGQNISFQGLSDSPVVFLSAIMDTRSVIWRSFVSPPTSTWWEISTERLRRTGKSVNFFTLTYKRGVQWAWINRLDVAERAITQDEGLGAAEGLRCHFLFFFFFFFFTFRVLGQQQQTWNP